MTVDWEIYRPDWPPFGGPLRLLSRKEARISYKHFLRERSNRVDQLKALLAQNGLTLAFDDAQLQVANEWFDGNLERSQGNPRKLGNLWYSVIYDFSVFIGEMIISRHLDLHWECFVWGKQDISYHSPVIMGFDNIPKRKINMNLSASLITHAYRITHDMPEPRDHFVSLVRGAEDLLAIGKP